MEGGANSFWLFLIDHTFYNSQCTYLTKDLWGAEQLVCCYFSPTLSSINLLIVSQMYHSLSYLMSLHLLFPLPVVLCLQIIEWFHLCFIQVSAYMLSSLERPSFPYLSSFFCIAISYHIILSHSLQCKFQEQELFFFLFISVAQSLRIVPSTTTNTYFMK